MATRGSRRVVYAALVSNIAIAVCKYAAAIITGSSSLLAEAFHSTVDTGTELLLALGMKRSRRPPSALHPFGHGKAMYFYSLLVSVYTFGIGGALAIHYGIITLRNPQMLVDVGWSYAVLALAAAFDAYSWRISYIELRSRHPRRGIWELIVASKDPAVFTVFLEDSVGLIGTFVAFVGIFLGQVLHNPYLDPAGSILIGLLLIMVAIFLGRESGALLVGERVHTRSIRRIRAVIQNDATVEKVGNLVTMQLGPDEALLTVNVRFKRNLRVEQVETAVQRIESEIRKKEADKYRIFIETDPLEKEIINRKIRVRFARRNRRYKGAAIA